MTLLSRKGELLLREEQVIDRIVDLCIDRSERRWLDGRWLDGGAKVIRARNGMQLQFRRLLQCITGSRLL